MGFHVCEYCQGDQKETSSGDVILKFANGNTYMVPDMILHYVADHKFTPPEQFINDVLHCAFTGGERWQTKGMPVKVGYISGDFPQGQTPSGFFERLWSVMNRASKYGSRIQTRGI